MDHVDTVDFVEIDGDCASEPFEALCDPSLVEGPGDDVVPEADELRNDRLEVGLGPRWMVELPVREEDPHENQTSSEGTGQRRIR